MVGFYSFFSTVPRGKHLIRVCLGTACYVRGGMEVLEALKKELGIDVGETTEDREFSLEVARCFGACGLAPVITINDVVHHRVKPARINEMLAQYAEEPVPRTTDAVKGASEAAGASGQRRSACMADKINSPDLLGDGRQGQGGHRPARRAQGDQSHRPHGHLRHRRRRPRRRGLLPLRDGRATLDNGHPTSPAAPGCARGAHGHRARSPTGPCTATACWRSDKVHTIVRQPPRRRHRPSTAYLIKT